VGMVNVPPDGNGEKQRESHGGQVSRLKLMRRPGQSMSCHSSSMCWRSRFKLCAHPLDLSVADLERHAAPVLDELTKDVSTRNLERVRNLKSHVTLLLARVQKVSLRKTLCA
jgi:magnesium transporter